MSETKQIVITHPKDNQTAEFVEQTGLHCVECGNKTVVVEIGEGDFYDGPTNYCTSCFASFTVGRGIQYKNIELIN